MQVVQWDITPNSRPSYQCDVCHAQILPDQHTRIHCLSCSDFDLCANCHLSGFLPSPASSPGHIATHQVQIVKPNRATAAYWDKFVVLESDEWVPGSSLLRISDRIFDWACRQSARQTDSWSKTFRMEPPLLSWICDVMGFNIDINMYEFLLGQLKGGGYSTTPAIMGAHMSRYFRDYGFEHVWEKIGALDQQTATEFRDDLAPCLTVAGFRAWMFSVCRLEPATFHVGINNLLRWYPELRLGADQHTPLPRELFPAETDAQRDEQERQQRVSYEKYLADWANLQNTPQRSQLPPRNEANSRLAVQQEIERMENEQAQLELIQKQYELEMQQVGMIVTANQNLCNTIANMGSSFASFM